MLVSRKLLLLVAYLVVVGAILKEIVALTISLPPGGGCPGSALVCPPNCRKVGGEWQDACGNPSPQQCCEYLFRIAACLKGTPPNEILCSTGTDIIPQGDPIPNTQCESQSQDCKPVQTTTGVPSE